MLSYVHYKLFVLKFPDRSEWGSRLQTDDNGELHIILTELRQTKALVLCIQLSHKRSLSSSMDTTQQYSKLMHIPTRIAQHEI
jgi:hypothetical protein